MSDIIKRIELSYQQSDGTLTSNLSAVESFRGHTANGKHFVGVFIHTENGGNGDFHLFEVCFLENMLQLAEFKFENYIAATLNDLEHMCRIYTFDPTFTLDEAADNLSIFSRYLENGC